jgi:predicted anti-sigma-YlaC factor YlaD
MVSGWNFRGPATDYGVMRCEDVHLALSARLDGEAETQPRALVDAHLAGCERCRDWLALAERVTRMVRVQAVAVPDLTERIIAASHADGSLPGLTRPRASAAPEVTAGPAVGLRWLRLLLGVLAVVQLMLAVPDLLGAVGHDAHAGREVAAFDIALAVGLLIAACYPEHARIFAPVVLTLVMCFAAISTLDVLQGVVAPGRVAIHMIAVLQAGLLWLLARRVEPRPAPA